MRVSHDFILRLHGSNDTTGYVDVYAGAKVDIFRNFEPGTPGGGEVPEPQIWLSGPNVGMIRVYSEPFGADVYLNNNPVRYPSGNIVKTPVTIADVPAGAYQVTFKMPGHLDEMKTVDVGPGAWSDVTATMRTRLFKIRIKDDDMKEDIGPLILGLEKPIYLAATGPLEESSSEIIGWTTTKPQYNNGDIDKGSVLIFVKISPEEDIKGHRPLEFMIIHTGTVPGEFPVYLLEEEIDALTKEGAFTLLELEDVEEISIVLGKIFTKYPDYIADKELSFDATVSAPKNTYIIMSPEEMRNSNAQLITGEKISLQHIIDVYSKSIGRNLISK